VDRAVAIVVAAGSGDRLGLGIPKAFVELGGTTLLGHAVANALRSHAIERVVAVVPRGSEDEARALLAGQRADVVPGGTMRAASVRSGLEAIGAERAVVVHDAARPLAPPALFDAVVERLSGADGVVPAVPIADTVKRVREGLVERTEPREDLVAAQTPQAFVTEALRDAHGRVGDGGTEPTDDAAALEAAGYRVRIVEGAIAAMKVTTLGDLLHVSALYEQLLRQAPDARTGRG
jgi:2-C-methyl-D-erythritol 4-phosphate cytidylyltransferase